MNHIRRFMRRNSHTIIGGLITGVLIIGCDRTQNRPASPSQLSEVDALEHCKAGAQNLKDTSTLSPYPNTYVKIDYHEAKSWPKTGKIACLFRYVTANDTAARKDGKPITPRPFTVDLKTHAATFD